MSEYFGKLKIILSGKSGGNVRIGTVKGSFVCIEIIRTSNQ